MDRKVFINVGFSDFASPVSVVFSGCYPATVSDFETVFLCPLSALATILLPMQDADAFLHLTTPPSAATPLRQERRPVARPVFLPEKQPARLRLARFS